MGAYLYCEFSHTAIDATEDVGDKHAVGQWAELYLQPWPAYYTVFQYRPVVLAVRKIAGSARMTFPLSYSTTYLQDPELNFKMPHFLEEKNRARPLPQAGRNSSITSLGPSTIFIDGATDSTVQVQMFFGVDRGGKNCVLPALQWGGGEKIFPVR